MNQVKSKDSNSKQGSELLEAVGGTPVAPSQSHAELVLHEQIKNLNSSCNFWRLMFFAVFLGYGVAWWLV